MGGRASGAGWAGRGGRVEAELVGHCGVGGAGRVGRRGVFGAGRAAAI